MVLATRASDRTLVAEGDYVGQKTDADKPLAHWKLWRLGDGGYEVVDLSAKNAPLTQVFRFDAQFLPMGYSFKIASLSKEQAALHPDAAAAIRPVSVSCQYGTHELRCEAQYQGQKSTASIPAKQPYVFIPGELYPLDFAWFLTGVVRLTERAGPANDGVNVYAMTDRKGGHNQIALTPDIPIKLAFIGEETAQVMGRTQAVRRYESRGLGELSVLRVTPQGLVASISGKSGSGEGFGIGNYRQYEPWGPAH